MLSYNGMLSDNGMLSADNMLSVEQHDISWQHVNSSGC
jgi:hypothetical protein